MSKEKFDPLTQGELTKKIKADLKGAEQAQEELKKAKEAGYSSVETYRLVEPFIKELTEFLAHDFKILPFATKNLSGKKRDKIEVVREKIRREGNKAIEELRGAFKNVNNEEVYPQASDPEDWEDLSRKLRRDARDKIEAHRSGYPSVEVYRAIWNIRDKFFGSPGNKGFWIDRENKKYDKLANIFQDWRHELGLKDAGTIARDNRA